MDKKKIGIVLFFLVAMVTAGIGLKNIRKLQA